MPRGAAREIPLSDIPGAGLLLYANGGQDSSGWFGPGTPMAPVAPQAEGRAFDYQPYLNLQYRPKTGEGVTFEQLRALADAYDLLRLAIETRKDQMDILAWTIRPRDLKRQRTKAADRVQEALSYPDREHTWSQWLRMLLEDLFVIDAPTIYLRRTVGGAPWGLEILDGATIKRVLDATGRTPMEGPAYQQILKGLPAVDYTREQLIYAPRNLRPNRVYGYSPVEQVITTVNIALRRQIHQLSYYTEGSTPNLIFSVPKEWTPDQIRQFQSWWDSLLAGNPAGRARARFVPEGIKPIDTKEQALKDEYDEWLARVICYAFSLSPQPFVRVMNRATAETAQEMARQEGLRPLQNWLKALMDRIIREFFGEPDLEFAWQDDEAIDPLVRAQVHQIYIAAGVLTPNEVRQELGLEPIPEAEEAAPAGPSPSETSGQNEPGEPAPSGASEGPKAERLAKAGRRVAPINRQRPAIVKAQRQLAAAVRRLFRAQATELARQIEEAIRARFGKAAGVSDEDIDWIVAQLNLEGWDSLTPKAQEILERIAMDGGAAALEQLGVDSEQAGYIAMVNQINRDAVEWAEDRAAELVTRIADTTRERLRSDVVSAIEQGLSTDELADLLADSYGFSDARAEMIARTEIAFADVAGNVIAYKASGVVSALEWIVSSEGGCPICEANTDAVVPLGGVFPSGDSQPPAHPNCICDVLPVVSEEEAEE